MSDFERELESELHRVLDPMSVATIPPRRSIESGGTMKKLLGGTGAAITLKVLTGIIAAAAAITVAGAATTGGLTPFGQQVKHEVAVCKDTLRASGVRGIGQCVSAFAKTHGQSVASGARQNGSNNASANGQANSHGKNKGNANGHGKPTNLPTGRPSSAATPEP
jgi:hypothetical protein